MVTKKYRVYYVEVAEHKINEKGAQYKEIIGELKYVNEVIIDDVKREIKEMWPEKNVFINYIKEEYELRGISDSIFYEKSKLLKKEIKNESIYR